MIISNICSKYVKNGYRLRCKDIICDRCLVGIWYQCLRRTSKIKKTRSSQRQDNIIIWLRAPKCPKCRDIMDHEYRTDITKYLLSKHYLECCEILVEMLKWHPDGQSDVIQDYYTEWDQTQTFQALLKEFDNVEVPNEYGYNYSVLEMDPTVEYLKKSDYSILESFATRINSRYQGNVDEPYVDMAWLKKTFVEGFEEEYYFANAVMEADPIVHRPFGEWLRIVCGLEDEYVNREKSEEIKPSS